MPINSFLYPGAKVTTGYDVDNSLRFNRPSDDSLTRTFGSSGNRKTWSFSTWIKRCNLINANMNILGTAYTVSSGEAYLLFRPGEKLHYGQYESGGTANNYSFETNQVFRDVSAWYNILFVWDTTQSTSSNRMKLFVNGTQVTSFSSSTYPSLNLDGVWNSNKVHYIGDAEYGTNLDGYLCETVFVDGTALSPTDVGEFDEDSGIWKPIDVSGLTFGTNGFYLDFEDSSALGNDVAGSNNFTVNNLTAIDQSTDTCTNNFATFNPLTNRSGTTATHSEGNLKVVWSGGTNTPSMGTIGVQSGKWYYESKMFWGSNSYIGITYDSTPTNTDVKGYLLRQTGEKYDAFTGSGSSYTSALSSGDTVMIAFDADNGTLWFGVNGTWSNSATQSEIENGTTTNSAFSSIDTDNYIWLPMGKGGINSNARIEANFGSPIYSISSGNTDGNGYGNFEYAVPNGYYSLNSKNLAEYG